MWIAPLELLHDSFDGDRFGAIDSGRGVMAEQDAAERKKRQQCAQ
jgi:hypothetical protein